jgi:hypothetical protein
MMCFCLVLCFVNAEEGVDITESPLTGKQKRHSQCGGLCAAVLNVLRTQQWCGVEMEAER